MKFNKDYIISDKRHNGYLYLNEDNTEILIKNCFKLEFIGLYPNIIISLYKEGYLSHIPVLYLKVFIMSLKV